MIRRAPTAGRVASAAGDTGSPRNRRDPCMSRSPRRGRQDQASAAPPPPAAHRRLPTKARTRSRSTHLGPPDRDPARNEGWMRREPRLRDQTQEDYVSDREAAWEAAVIATDARHPGAKPPAGRNYFPGKDAVGAAGTRILRSPSPPAPSVPSTTGTAAGRSAAATARAIVSHHPSYSTHGPARVPHASSPPLH